MDCGSLPSFLSGRSACATIAFFPDGKVSVCTTGFATRPSDEGEGDGKAVDVPPSLIATTGAAVDEGEGSGKAVDEAEVSGKAVDEAEVSGKAVDEVEVSGKAVNEGEGSGKA